MVDRYRVDESTGTSHGPDTVLVEEPLEIRLDGELVATTMRTPGHDFELAVGFCHGEGWLAGARVSAVRYCATGGALETAYNIVTIETTGATVTPTPRLGNVTSSCGWCGTDSVDALAARLSPLTPVELDPEVLRSLTAMAGRVEPHQELFSSTGGSHAAAVFELAGGATVVREDIGRHNALDKCVGRLVLDRASPQSPESAPESLPAEGHGVWISGRASFEMVQKAWAAGAGVVVSVSAASSLAVETASRAGITLFGFARGHDLVRYC